MKKFSICILSCLMILCICKVNANIANESEDYYRNLTKEAVNFVSRLQTCSPSKIYDQEKNKRLIIHGKTKNKMCYYSGENNVAKYSCLFPMPVAVGLSTSLLDVIDYTKDEKNDIATERLKQFFEIAMAANDYCKYTYK